MLERRKLSPVEIEKVLSAISSFRIDRRAHADDDAPVLESLRLTLRESLATVEIPDSPDFVEMLRKRLRTRFLCSLMCPGINEGARAASANSEPFTQEILKAVQSTGAKRQEVPIIDILKMKEELATEFFFTVPDTGVPPVEWYLEKSRGSELKDIPVGIPPDANFLVSFALSSIVSPLSTMVVRSPNGSFIEPVYVVLDSNNVHPFLRSGDWSTWNLYNGKELIFYVIRFSMQEILKLRLSIFQVVENVRDHISNSAAARGAKGNVIVAEISVEYFTIAIVTSSATLTHALAMSVVKIGDDVSTFTSFELLQKPTMQVVTSVEEVPSSALGLIAPRRNDGNLARSWIFHMTSPNVQVPARHLCAFLDALGFQIIDADKTGSGRHNALHVAESKYAVNGSVEKWIDAESQIVAKWHLITMSPRCYDHIETVGNYQDPVEILLEQGFELQDALSRVRAWFSVPDPYIAFRQDERVVQMEMLDARKDLPIVSWKDSNTSPFLRTSVFYSLKFSGHRSCLESIFRDLRYDWTCSRNTNIPVCSKILCAPVARQLMDFMWVTQVASAKVSQAAGEYITLFGAGTGPNVQPVNQSAIRAAGPLNGLTENPEKVLLEAAVLSETYGNAGAIPSVVTGSMSKDNGTGAVTVVVASTGEVPSFIKHARDGLENDSRIYGYANAGN